ncbi:MAG: 50S ribosomal protein L6 [bacterium]|nr:50S ribosomal protein L6 [bacterium]
MSRIGKTPIAISSEVKVQLENNILTVQGPKGKLSQELSKGINFKLEDKKIVLTRDNDDKTGRSLHGLMRSLIANMVKGVTEGYKKELDIIGVGFRAQVKDKKLIMQLGFSHPIEYPAPNGINLSVDEKGTRITVSGFDKQLVGETAAVVRRFKEPEPYKGKGIRYVNEYVRKKAGKAAAGAGAAK